MKIAVWHNLPSGGAKRALYYHTRGLAQRGHTIEAWCPSTADQTYLPLSGLIREHVKPLHLMHIASVKNTFKKAWLASFHMFHDIQELDNHCRQCAEEINHEGFDILFTYNSLPIAVSSIAKYVKIPTSIYLNEPLRGLYEAIPRLPWIEPDTAESHWKLQSMIKLIEDHYQLKYIRRVAREEWTNIRLYDSVLANSLFSRESILRAYGTNSRVCYLGVDSDLFINQHKQKSNFVIGVGSFSPAKNIDFVIRSLAKVRSPRPSLVWVGNYSFQNYLDELKRLSISMNVDFQPMEMIDDHQLVDLLNSAMAMVYAPRLEPFGFAPLEANACGLSVIAVAEGGIRETIMDGVNGLLVDYDEGSMAHAIERIRDDSHLARSLGENGHKIVLDKWSLSASIDRIEHCLKILI